MEGFFLYFYFFLNFHFTRRVKRQMLSTSFFYYTKRYCYGCGVAVDLVLNLFAVEYITF